MAQAGYCSECKANVWLTADCACPAGHGAECISGIDEPRPRAPLPSSEPSADTPISTERNPLIRMRRIAGRLRRKAASSWDLAVHTRVVPSGPDDEGRLFLPVGYRFRVKPRYFDANPPDADVIFQPDVYSVVEEVAAALGASTIVDIGCGKGGKLEPLASGYTVIGADFGTNLEFCRSTYEWGKWIEADLDSSVPLAIAVDDYRGGVLVSADVVEHLVHPKLLLKMVHDMLESAGAAVLSTPDRVRTRGGSDEGPPGNPSHVREWELTEFCRLLNSCGLRVVFSGYTRANTLDNTGKTILVICAGSHMSLEEVELVKAIGRRAGERWSGDEGMALSGGTGADR